MGREVRMVPADWVHPVAYDYMRGKDRLVPLHKSGGYEQTAKDWDEGWQKWQEGLCESYGTGPKWEPIEPEHLKGRYTEYAGSRPSPDDYMPDWSKEQRTHYMMYEDTSEGTPISPAFETPEDLAQWLVDNKASSFGGSEGTYEGWLRVAKGGFAPSLVVTDGVAVSGVDMDVST